jgi:ATPase subunit of ABC transporter with duplicated ATPase domains
MLTLDRISTFHGANPILVEVTLGVPPRDRLGVVGPNGVGKSTLLRIAAGLDEPDSGTVTRTPASLTVGYMPQEPESRTDETLLGYLARRTGVAEAEAHLDALTERLDGRTAVIAAHAEALERFLALGGDDLHARARTACGDVGLPAEWLELPMTALSGGEAARAALAAILLARFDVLLLDEPTNNLDFEGLDRLERFVAGTRAGIVVVSHDRAFLDRTVGRVLELDEWTHRARGYTGGWSDYQAARERERAEQYRRYEAVEREREEIETLLRARRSQAGRAGARVLARETGGSDRRATHALSSKVRQAERALERLEDVEKPYEPWDLRLSLASGARSGRIVARLEQAVVVRGSFRLGPLDFQLDWGERVALLGSNGSGKTTILEALLGRLALDEGRRYIGPGARIGELDQERARFAGDEALLDSFCREGSVRTDEARSLLAKFGLGAGDVFRPARSLSPGERTRAAVALLALRGVNCLLLDEPTNHLDLPAIEELETALERYGGTVLLVTHDRRFLERFAAARTVELSAPHAPRSRA